MANSRPTAAAATGAGKRRVKRPKRSQLERQISLTFQYRENLTSIVRDFQNLDKMIPSESSRHGCLMKDVEAMAIIESRKNDLLSYIQMICRDHIIWSNKLLAEGWEAPHGE